MILRYKDNKYLQTITIEVVGWGFVNYCPSCGSNKGNYYPFSEPVKGKDCKCSNCNTYFCKSELMSEMEYKNHKRTKLIDKINAEKEN